MCPDGIELSGHRPFAIDLARQISAIPHVGVVSRNVLKLQSSTLQVSHAEGTLELLRRWLDQDVPVIAFVQTSELPFWGGGEARHAVVVVGLDDENVYLLDPACDPGAIPVSIGDFGLAWEDWMDGRHAAITRIDRP